MEDIGVLYYGFPPRAPLQLDERSMDDGTFQLESEPSMDDDIDTLQELERESKQLLSGLSRLQRCQSYTMEKRLESLRRFRLTREQAFLWPPSPSASTPTTPEPALGQGVMMNELNALILQGREHMSFEELEREFEVLNDRLRRQQLAQTWNLKARNALVHNYKYMGHFVGSLGPSISAEKPDQMTSRLPVAC